MARRGRRADRVAHDGISWHDRGERVKICRHDLRACLLSRGSICLLWHAEDVVPTGLHRMGFLGRIEEACGKYVGTTSGRAYSAEEAFACYGTPGLACEKHVGTTSGRAYPAEEAFAGYGTPRTSCRLGFTHDGWGWAGQGDKKRIREKRILFKVVI